METFNFPYHTTRTIWPPPSYKATFGSGYEFSSKPDAPPQRRFMLRFNAFKYFVDAGTGFPEAVTSPLLNYMTFINFYSVHKTHEPFLYNHPVFGQLTVKFSKSLEDPEHVGDGTGVVGGLEVELIEQP